MAIDRKSCVLYVLDQAVADYRKIATAQAEAIKNSLPIAVVYCMAEWDTETLARLRSVEQQLTEHAIVLIILIGESATTRAGIIHHTQPFAVFDDATESKPDAELVDHPYIWPGKVLTINELVRLEAEGNLFC